MRHFVKTGLTSLRRSTTRSWSHSILPRRPNCRRGIRHQRCSTIGSLRCRSSRTTRRTYRRSPHRRPGIARSWCSHRIPLAALSDCRCRASSCCCRCGATAPSALRGADHIHYVLPFENRGAEVGVTLHHPHGQIYAYPFVPPVPERMLAQESAFYAQHGRPLLGAMAEDEMANGQPGSVSRTSTRLHSCRRAHAIRTRSGSCLSGQ